MFLRTGPPRSRALAGGADGISVAALVRAASIESWPIEVSPSTPRVLRAPLSSRARWGAAAISALTWASSSLSWGSFSLPITALLTAR